MKFCYECGCELEGSEKVCPECGEPVENEYTRIVGFYTPVKTYSKARKAEFELREWMPLNEKGANA